MPELIHKSDIIISRAGASTLSEIAIIGKPCIFIPLPNTLDGDQESNARNFELSNAAIVYNQNSINPDLSLENVFINNQGNQSIFEDSDIDKLIKHFKGLSIDQPLSWYANIDLNFKLSAEWRKLVKTPVSFIFGEKFRNINFLIFNYFFSNFLILRYV